MSTFLYIFSEICTLAVSKCLNCEISTYDFEYLYVDEICAVVTTKGM